MKNSSEILRPEFEVHSSSPDTELKTEGPVAKAIEKKTTKIPSDAFLWAALGSIGISAGLQLFGRKNESTFVGHWAPTILILGLYNKLVKIAGSDQKELQQHAMAQARPM